jgi:hypothetical protein
LSGRDIDETTREGVPSVSIAVGVSPHVAAVRTDRRGDFTLHAAATWTGDEPVRLEADAHHAPEPLTWGDVRGNDGLIYLRRNPLVWFAALDAESGAPIDDFGLIVPHGLSGQGPLTERLASSEVVDDPGSSRRGIAPPFGACVVRVTAAGHVPAHVVLPAQSSGRRGGVSTVRLMPTVAISCEVVSSTGGPVPGCSVQAVAGVTAEVSEASRVVEVNRPLPLVNLGAAHLEQACGELAIVIDEVATDARGLASVSASASRGAMLRITPSERRPTWVRLAESDLASGRLRVVLPAPRVLAGTVGPRAWIDEVWNDRPEMAPVLRVQTGSDGNASLGTPIAAIGATAPIDREGRFEVELGGHTGRWSVVWRLPGAEGESTSLVQRLGGSVTDHDTLAIDMSGFMLGTATGEIHGAEERNLRLSAHPPLLATLGARTDREGRFSLRLPGGTYRVSIQSEDESRWITLERDWYVASGTTQGGAWELCVAEVRIRIHEATDRAGWWGIVDAQGNRRAAVVPAEGEIVLSDLQSGPAFVIQGEGGSASPRLEAFLRGQYGQGRVAGSVMITGNPGQVIEIGSHGRVRPR